MTDDSDATGDAEAVADAVDEIGVERLSDLIVEAWEQADFEGGGEDDERSAGDDERGDE